MKKIIIYTTPTCHYCKNVKEFLDEKKLKYTVIDVAADKVKRAELIEKSGQMGVPVTMIGDKIIIGFNKEALLDALIDALK